MSDEEETSIILTGSSAPESKDSGLLFFGALAAAGLGFYIWNKKKKDEEKSDGSKTRKKKEVIEAGPDQVVFASDYSSYEVGEEWLARNLDPYLEDMIENHKLAIPEWKTKGPLGWGVTEEGLLEMMQESRANVLSAFTIGHFVTVGGKEKTIASLPVNEATQHFRASLDTHIKEFQENY